MRFSYPRPYARSLCLTLVTGLILMWVVAIPAQDARLAGPEAASRARISDALSKGDLATVEKEMEALKAKAAPAAGQAPKSGLINFEEIKACGFYPQETRLECVIEIKQKGGYGGLVGAFGSFEFVQFCVDWNGDGVFSASEVVGMGIVQMHDEPPAGASPPWQYAVYRDINPPGGLRTSNTGASATTVTSGATRKARATLAWSTAPTGCNYSPFWGNIVDFTIRIDPIR